MKQSIRVGLCGFGFMGKTHLYALSNLPYFYDLPYRAEVIGVCTAHRETADAAAEAFGIRRVYACEADMIADGDIDVIDICTPNPCHFTTARAAISAGKHVLCEKTADCVGRGVARAGAACRINRADLRCSVQQPLPVPCPAGTAVGGGRKAGTHSVFRFCLSPQFLH